MVRFSNKLGHYRFHLTFSQLVFLDVISRPKRDLYPFGDFSVYHYERVCAGAIHRGKPPCTRTLPTRRLAQPDVPS
jgi:hypothetical protein